jgi:hypothetical protein
MPGYMDEAATMLDAYLTRAGEAPPLQPATSEIPLSPRPQDAA